MAWAARAARAGRVKGAGALGPVEAFGLEELEARLRATPGSAASADLSRREPQAHQRRRASRPAGSTLARPPVTRSGGLRRAAQSSSAARRARARAEHRRLAQRPDVAARRAEPVASRIPLTARRAASLAPSIVARSV